MIFSVLSMAIIPWGNDDKRGTIFKTEQSVEPAIIRLTIKKMYSVLSNIKIKKDDIKNNFENTR